MGGGRWDGFITLGAWDLVLGWGEAQLSGSTPRLLIYKTLIDNTNELVLQGKGKELFKSTSNVAKKRST